MNTGKITGFCNRTKQFIRKNGVKLMAAGVVGTALMDPGTASAVDYDPAALTTGIATLFQGAIVIAAGIVATRMGIRVVKKAMGII